MFAVGRDNVVLSEDSSAMDDAAGVPSADDPADLYRTDVICFHKIGL